MKTQQRTFVIEFKSGRRRSSMKQDAIWGDTDLKALAREAEAEAPHLFEPSPGSIAQGQDSLLLPDSEPANHNDDKTETADEKKIPVSLVEAAQNCLPQRDDVSAFTQLPELEANRPRRGPSRVSRRRRDAGAIVDTKRANGAAVVRSTTAQVEVPTDELIALDRENRRLKGLLANHLRQQNMQLREMLERLSCI
ncbi:hypothetical protein [Rhizobium lusitanum]|uniref:hypothetical protein n=1 Tax=Rhizobium lusitanum TaxID=293958 RepID=UPI001574239F|nr:hypothetical protein [Rhizobium lusitanum]NTJ11625.1 hypothetical protein [Rhizobium lusitanum]